MKIMKVVLGLICVAAVVAAIFFGIQYSRGSSQNDALASRVESLEGQIDTLESENKSLDLLYQQTIKRNDELAGEKIELQRKLLAALTNNTVLENKIKDLEKEIGRLSQPPVSPDASTPWERARLSFELWTQGDWETYWEELLSSEFKSRCPKERFVLLLTRLNPPPPEVVFIDQAIGDTHAVVWVSLNGKVVTQLLLLEDGKWMMSGGRGC